MLLSGAALVVEPHHPVRLHRQVGDNEAHAGKQLARMPLDLGDHAAWFVPALRLILEILVEALDLGQRGAPHRPGQPMCNLLPQHGIGRQPNGVEIASLFEPCVDRRAGIGGVGAEEAATKLAASGAGDHRVEHIPPVVGAVDIAMTQGTAFQHPELVEHKERMVAGAVEMPVPGGALLLAMGRADRAVHVQRDVLQPAAIMKPVDPLAVQIGQRLPVLGHGQRLGLEPTHLRGRGSLRVNSTAPHDLTHDRVEGETVSIVNILVARQPTIDRLPKQPVDPVNNVLASAVVAQRRRREGRQPERVIKLAHHQQATVGTELRAAKFQPHPTVEINPITPFRTRTLRVIHEIRPKYPATL